MVVSLGGMSSSCYKSGERRSWGTSELAQDVCVRESREIWCCNWQLFCLLIRQYTDVCSVQFGHGPIGQEPLSARHRPARTLRASGSDQNRTNANKENMQPKLYLTNTQLIWSKAYIDHHGIMRYLVRSVHVGLIAMPVLFGRNWE